MHSLTHTFKNNGLGEYNDDVFDERLFDLSANEYTFTIKPKSGTQFWRLGIRLSKTEEIEFFHPKARYKEPEFRKYKDIHLGVGEWDKKNWILPNRIHLMQYN